MGAVGAGALTAPKRSTTCERRHHVGPGRHTTSRPEPGAEPTIATLPSGPGAPAATSPRTDVAARPTRARLAATFRALHNRNYRLFWTGQLVSLTGGWMQRTAMAWLVIQIT